MELFDVYNLLDIEPESGWNTTLRGADGTEYLDLYGGHAVISIGHTHPHFVHRINEQLKKLAFYSNSVINPLQIELAELLGEVSGYPDYNLFLCNSGAEANENALKVASFHNQKDKIIVIDQGFHGRTGGVVEFTQNQSIVSEFNRNHKFKSVPLNDTGALENAMDNSVAAILIEPIQGIAGVYAADQTFLQKARELATKFDAVLIFDEIQCGYGRTGQFFAHQHIGVQPDIITIAKGMGNGFPVGGVLINPEFESYKGMLGTTFGGNHLACTATLAVLEVIKDENLVENAQNRGNQLVEALRDLPGIKEVRGSGLMVGIEFFEPVGSLRKSLLEDNQILVGTSSNPNVMRILPPLSISAEDVETFIDCLKEAIAKTMKNETLYIR